MDAELHALLNNVLMTLSEVESLDPAKPKAVAKVKDHAKWRYIEITSWMLRQGKEKQEDGPVI